MKLLIDLGNTRLKWAWFARGEFSGAGALHHAGLSIGDMIGALGAPVQPLTGVRIVSVARPELTEALTRELARTYGVDVERARSQAAAAGVRNGYVDPEQLGPDRWLAIIAAYLHCRSAVCVVDAGTAWTVDAVAADGQHLGGLIIPGPTLMRAALRAGTGGIASAADRLADAPREINALGRDTESCIRSGTIRAAACLVESCMRAVPRDSGSRAPALVVTGGDAPLLLGDLPRQVEHRPLLVLEGLALQGGDTPAAPR